MTYSAITSSGVQVLKSAFGIAARLPCVSNVVLIQIRLPLNFDIHCLLLLTGV
jgi:hypothetical protein